MVFSLHAYLKHLRRSGASSLYIDAIKRNAKPLVDNNLPVVLSLNHLAHITDTPYKVLQKIISREIDPYRVFAIRKRRGGKRFICVPELSLLRLQRWVHDNILCSSTALKKLSNQSTAYKPGSSHIENARYHLGAEWLLKLDLTSFFESISERQVYYVFRRLGYSSLMAFNFARLCTRILPPQKDLRLRFNNKRWQASKNYRFLKNSVVGHLPQGAPTSPMLANLVCVTLDKKLQTIASNHDVVYSRYADDLTFSGDVFKQSKIYTLIKEVSSVVSCYGFKINSQKTSIAKKGSRKIVTGISVEGDQLRLPRVYKDKIRQELYYIEKYGLHNHCFKIGSDNPLPYLLRIAGKIRYVALIEPELGNRMLAQLKKSVPQLQEIEQLVNNKY